MSDIVFRNMEMPKSCGDCQICFSHLGNLCPVTSDMIAGKGGKFFLDKRHPNCPLKELPQHGDLIDRRKLWKDTEGLGEYCHDRDFISLCDAIADAPTILEASKED